MKTMKRITPIGLLLFTLVWTAAISARQTTCPAPAARHLEEVRGTKDLLPVPFLENSGQIAQDDVRYYANTEHGVVYVTSGGEIFYALHSVGLASPAGPAAQPEIAHYAIKESLLHSALPQFEGEDRFPAQISDFRGNDSARWRADIPAYATVNLGEVYPGVVLKVRAAASNVEKLFFVQPAADPACIRLEVEGVDGLEVNTSGELEAATALGQITFTRPIAYQMETQGRQLVEVAYVVDGKQYGFAVGNYDRSRELIIDPLLASTFLGGGHNELVADMLLDTSGNVYVTGWTASTDFPATIGAHDTTFNGNLDVFVAKFDSALDNLLACTYIGGSSGDEWPAIAQADDGNIFVLGRTRSSDFPTTANAFDTTFAGWSNCFVAKFDSDLQDLLAATYLGGESNAGDSSADILVAADGGVYVTGGAGLNFPTTPGAYAETIGDYQDAFVAKLSNNLESLVASTYLGGDSADVSVAMALDAQGNVVVGGHTESWNFPLTGGTFDSTHNGGIYDAFLAKLDPGLQSLLASTFLGGSADDIVSDLVLDGAGNVLVTGATYSTNFPVTAAAFDPDFAAAPEAFVFRINSGFTELLAATFIGSTGYEWAQAMALNGSGSVYIAGTVSSPDFPVTPGAYDSGLGGGDVFVAKMNLNLSSLHAAACLGGTYSDTGYALAINNAGEVYVGGDTGSTNFPISSDCYDASYNGYDHDGFVAKLDRSLSDDTVVGVGDALPRVVVLDQNCPNPFNPVTNVSFDIASEGMVTLKVYDLLGREVTTLVEEELSAGRHDARWNAEKQASGTYLYRLTVLPSDGIATGASAVRKMQLVR